ncbi:HNH endonuclease [Lichenihabitans sp. PAMC28606]|uniref:HNH endonuclease n=1 Tax=Lichenihabitans sp. PAMC28606 TaxID=2880932 RepID=UPI001D0B7F74|nr:HNH endonuclease [Lichenihabitans sp. PAMC28606]UDL93177.1 HNH endonuclease [Lichenihabitans sp. PAMC28606]
MASKRLRFDLHDRGIEQEPASDGPLDPICPLCDRPIPPEARSSKHHLVPKLKGGAKGSTVLLHQICHSAIHARYTEADLARRFSDIEALKRDPALAEFLAWIKTKPADFHAGTATTRDHRRARDAADRR